jgi:hypothetical protein
MVNASLAFWAIAILFGMWGMMRLWQKEVIVTASIVLALFAIGTLNQGNRITNLVQDPPPNPNQQEYQKQVDAAKVTRWLLLAVPFLTIVFFGYMGPAITRQFSPGRFPERARAGIQEGIVGGLMGGFNGFLVLSTLAYWAWQLLILGPQPFPTNADPPLFVPPKGGWDQFFFIQNAAPVIFAGPVLIIALVLLFLFVIIAFI